MIKLPFRESQDVPLPDIAAVVLLAVPRRDLGRHAERVLERRFINTHYGLFYAAISTAGAVNNVLSPGRFLL